MPAQPLQPAKTVAAVESFQRLDRIALARTFRPGRGRRRAAGELGEIEWAPAQYLQGLGVPRVALENLAANLAGFLVALRVEVRACQRMQGAETGGGGGGQGLTRDVHAAV